jgi:hypothetical protein
MRAYVDMLGSFNAVTDSYPTFDVQTLSFGGGAWVLAKNDIGVFVDAVFEDEYQSGRTDFYVFDANGDSYEVFGDYEHWNDDPAPYTYEQFFNLAKQ